MKNNDNERGPRNFVVTGPLQVALDETGKLLILDVRNILERHFIALASPFHERGMRPSDVRGKEKSPALQMDVLHERPGGGIDEKRSDQNAAFPHMGTVFRYMRRNNGGFSRATACF